MGAGGTYEAFFFLEGDTGSTAAGAAAAGRGPFTAAFLRLSAAAAGTTTGLRFSDFCSKAGGAGGVRWGGAEDSAGGGGAVLGCCG